MNHKAFLQLIFVVAAAALISSAVGENAVLKDLVKAKPGEDIVLQCQAPREAAVGLLKWTRPDLKSGDVFFYRHGNSHNNYQHPSFRGRVTLRDTQLKGGDVSVILQNVTINDTGTYECWIIINSGSTEPATPQLIINIHLMVTESGGGAGETEDGEKTDEIITNGENKDINVRLCVGLSVFALLCLVAFMIIIKRKCVKETFYQLLSQRTGEQSYTNKSMSSSCSSLA